MLLYKFEVFIWSTFSSGYTNLSNTSFDTSDSKYSTPSFAVAGLLESAF